MNAADLLLMTSTSEGSPNVIKEAMACNCPIVTSDVGDVEWVLGNTSNCKIVNNDRIEEFVNSIKSLFSAIRSFAGS